MHVKGVDVALSSQHQNRVLSVRCHSVATSGMRACINDNTPLSLCCYVLMGGGRGEGGGRYDCSFLLSIADEPSFTSMPTMY